MLVPGCGLSRLAWEISDRGEFVHPPPPLPPFFPPKSPPSLHAHHRPSILRSLGFEVDANDYSWFMKCVPRHPLLETLRPSKVEPLQYFSIPD